MWTNETLEELMRSHSRPIPLVEGVCDLGTEVWLSLRCYISDCPCQLLELFWVNRSSGSMYNNAKSFLISVAMCTRIVNILVCEPRLPISMAGCLHHIHHHPDHSRCSIPRSRLLSQIYWRRIVGCHHVWKKNRKRKRKKVFYSFRSSKSTVCFVC